MKIHLGVGSNVGDRRMQLDAALAQLASRGLRLLRVSPIVESPAMLPPGAPAEWNRPFLNVVAEYDTDCTPSRLAAWIKEIERALGRVGAARWAPRPIDIDILLWGPQQIADDELRIPHAGLHERSFTLTPLVALEPRMTIPGLPAKTALEWSRELPHHIPLWMGIVNVTPDSFSDGGRYRQWSQARPWIDAMVAAGGHIVDFGAESTRPGAEPVAAEQEWARLEPVLAPAIERYSAERLRPLISVDTYHPMVARRALRAGADIVNDVSGLSSPAMIEIAGESGADWIAMHHVTLPADASRTIAPGKHPFDEVERWLEARLEDWTRAGLDLGRIIFDPGIGFGKDSLQSLQLLRRAGQYRRHGLRVLVGHSRKSFMKSFGAVDAAERDLMTIGASMSLCAQGVDIIRVHDVPAHVRAYRGWAHLAGGE